MAGRVARLVLGGSCAGVLGTGAYATYLYQTDEGTRRAFRVYAQFGPVVLHYRWVEFKHLINQPEDSAAQADWKALDEQYAVAAVKALGELQGMYTKYGQTAAGFTNTFSDTWVQELRKLEDKVPPRPIEVVQQTILEETGRPWHETFKEFDPNPLGSASIGQVHRAVLLSGEEVAVKVQYPEAGRLFRADMATIRSFLAALAPEQLYMLGALEQQNALELDYRIEARNLERVAANMRRHGLAPGEVVVPEPVAGLSTGRMLVMTLLGGAKLGDALHAYARHHAQAQGTTLDALEAEVKAQLAAGQLPARYAGPSAATINAYLAWRRLLDTALNLGIVLYNLALGWCTGRLDLVWSAAPPNAPRIMDLVMRVHGEQLLADGLFNADPHGGNFVLLPDHRLGLIDFGATKELTRNERLVTCIIFAALMKKDEQMLIELSQVGGYRSKYGKKEVIAKLIAFGYDSWGSDVTGGKNLVQFTDELKAADPWHEVPDNLVMVQMLTIRLRALGLSMLHPVVCSDWWGPLALRILRAEGLPYETWDRRQLEQYRPELNMQVHRFG